MSALDLSPDELLLTTRSVRKRLDFSRPVEQKVVDEHPRGYTEAANTRQPDVAVALHG
ncbi:MAG: hypothetical protein NVS2B12_33360 [Ktedonobacteraceae bacterium]